MNLKHVFLGGAFALFALTACKKDRLNNDLEPTSESGTTYMSLTLNLPPDLAGMRAEDPNHNPIGDWGGRDEIKTVDIYLFPDGSTIPERKTLTLKTGATFGTDGVYETVAWKTKPGPKKIYVVVNDSDGSPVNTILKGSGELSSFSKIYTSGTLESSQSFVGGAFPINLYEQPFEVVGKTAYGGFHDTLAKQEGDKDVIVMTGDPMEVTIEDGVTEAAAKNHPVNNVKFTVRRVSARVTTTLDKTLHDQMTGEGIEIKATRGGVERTIAKIKNLAWAPAQYEKNMFLLSKPSVSEAISPAYAYVPAGDYQDKATKFYSYDLLADRYVLDPFTRNSDNKENVKQIIASPMKFITETTHSYEQNTRQPYRKGNTAYVLVTGTIYPEEGEYYQRYADELVAHYKPEELPAPTRISVEGLEDFQDLYLGVVDGKFYSKELLEEAKKNNKVPGSAEGQDGLIKFTNGKVYYILWINPDVIDPLKWDKSPVLRNNIYHININGIKKLGFSGNPLDPRPDSPDKPDVDEPGLPKPEDPLKEKETYMSAEITVLNWGVHSYDIEL